MTVHLPDDPRAFVMAKARGERLSSPDEAIAEAVRLLQKYEDVDSASMLAGIQQALDDMHAGRRTETAP